MKQRLDSLVADMAPRPDTSWEELVGVTGSRAWLKRTFLTFKQRLTPSSAIEPTSECLVSAIELTSECLVSDIEPTSECLQQRNRATSECLQQRYRATSECLQQRYRATSECL